jgi:hypothetical protein
VTEAASISLTATATTALASLKTTAQQPQPQQGRIRFFEVTMIVKKKTWLERTADPFTSLRPSDSFLICFASNWSAMRLARSLRYL